MTPRGAVTEKGPSIGSYRDRDIPSWINARGRRYSYDRVWNETYGCIDQLSEDEIVIYPGLIYKLATIGAIG